MKKLLCLVLALFVLAVPVSAQWDLLHDGEGLLTTEEAINLESYYADFSATHEFLPILVTTDSFEGRTAERYANVWYDSQGYPEDGILLLVSLTEGQWYILTSGICHDQISDWDAQVLGEELAEHLRDGAYYEAFAIFPELVDLALTESSNSQVGGVDAPASAPRNYGKTIAICMAVGLLIGLIAVGIMASMMKSVRSKNNAGDYVCPGSLYLSNQKDIFLYSHVHRTAKPKNTSSGSSGGSRGGAGGRI